MCIRRDKECILRGGLRQPTSAPPRAISPRAHPFPALLLAIVVFAVGAWSVLELVRARRLAEVGVPGAKWIWLSRSPDAFPTHFSAVRRFEISAPPRVAEARIFVDRRFQLWVNGSRAGQGGQAPGDAIRRIDVAPLLRAGSNVVAVVAESPIGIGGILFALDVGTGRPVIVSDGRWSVDPTGVEIASPTRIPATVLGRPPMRPWGWPR